MEPVTDTGLTDWDAVDSDHSSERAQALEAGGFIRITAEKYFQAAHSKNLRQGDE